MAAGPWKRRVRRIAVPAAVLASLGLLPPVQARVKALAVLAQSLNFSVPRPFAADVTRAEIELEGVTGDLYSPAGKAPGMVLVHGAAPRGKDDERLVRLAYSLARARRAVFVPALELANREFKHADIDRIATSVEALSRHVGDEVSVLGISYGGSLAMIAVAEPDIADRIDQLALFGAYYDLVGMIQGVTTGVSLIGDRRVGWDADPRALEVFRRYAVQLAPANQRRAVRAALKANFERDMLKPAGRAVVNLVENDDPASTYEIAKELSPKARELLAEFSPSSVVNRIRVPVLVLHSMDDPVVPYGEALRIKKALPDTRVATVRHFRHVDFTGASLLRAVPDAFNAWRFTSWVLSVQE